MLQNFIKNEHVEELKNKYLEILKNYKLYEFKNINLISEKQGVYLIFEESKIVYVGETKRELRIRLEQYLRIGDSGGTLRKNIELKKEITSEKAIKYIKKNLSIKIIEIENCNDRKNTEYLFIGLFCPKYNEKG